MVLSIPVKESRKVQLRRDICIEKADSPRGVARIWLILYLVLLAASGQVLQFKLSDIGEGIMEVTVKEWCVPR